jgi:hypothetical protein
MRAIIQSRALPSLSPIIQQTGIRLIPANRLKSPQSHPVDVGRPFEKFSPRRGVRTYDRDELQEGPQGFDHRSMVDYSVSYYQEMGYGVYKGEVGVAGGPAFADFAFVKDSAIVFGECLTVSGLKKQGTLEQKMKLARYGSMSITVPDSAIKHDALVRLLRRVGDRHTVLVYTAVGLGEREHRLTELNAYLFYVNASRHLPRLSARLEKKRLHVTMKINFADPVPDSMKEIELKETWRMALSQHLLGQHKSFLMPARLRPSGKKYLLTYEPSDVSNRPYTNRVLLPIRIQGDGVEASVSSAWARDIFRDRLVPLLRGKGIDREIKSFLSLAPAGE